MKFSIKCIIALGLLAVASVTVANPADRLNVLLQPIDSLKANFVQTVYDKKQKVVQNAAGIIEFKRPQNFRWHIVEPDSTLVVTDGKTLWNYDEMLAQVTVEPFDAKKEVSPLSFLFADPQLNFIVEEVNASTFKLTPKQENQGFKYLELFFKRGKITQLHLYDHLDQITVFEFMQVQNNPSLADNRFSFIPPAGVDVIGDH